MSLQITGLDALQRDLDQASQALAELDGEITTLKFDPADSASVESAIADLEQAIDTKISPYRGSVFVDEIADNLKAQYREQILERAAEARARSEESAMTNPPEIDQQVLRQMENIVTDLRRAETSTFEQHIKKLSRLLHSPTLEPLTSGLTEGIDLETWLQTGYATQGGMIGSARLDWPSEPAKELGTAILLIDRFTLRPDEPAGFARTFYYTNTTSISATLRHMTEQMIVPFARDYIDYIKQHLPKSDIRRATNREAAMQKVFVGHGHDGEPREAVARFLERLGLEAIILHERPNKGRTIWAKQRKLPICTREPDRTWCLSLDFLSERSAQNGSPRW